MKKKDDIANLYKNSKILYVIERILLGINILFALLSLTSCQLLREVSIMIQIIVALLFFISNMVDDGVVWYRAEQQRRKNNVEDGLGIKLSEFETRGYYNNNEKPSMERYGLNTLESNYFSKEIAGKMIWGKVLLTILGITALLISCRFIKELQITLIISQTVFSSYIFVDLCMLIIYKVRMDSIYKEAYNTFLLDHKSPEFEAWILAYAVEYEAIKAHYRIRLDNRLFKRNNRKLSKKWKGILIGLENSINHDG